MVLPPKMSAWILRNQILSQNFQQRPPVLIYQFGKVGSSTIRATLRRSPLKRPVYQIHRLSEQGIEINQKALRKHPNARHVMTSLVMAEELQKKLYTEGQLSSKVSVITITREPIAAMLSGFFQALDGPKLNQFLNPDGSLQTEQLEKRVRRHFKQFDESTNRICTWFDQELKTTLGIDVFAHPFDHDKKYQVIQTQNVDLLLLRLEDLNQIGGTVIAEFLGLPAPLRLTNRNQRSGKQLADLYAHIKTTLTLPKAVCRSIYHSQYATHFYSQKERKAFIQKWTAN
jgi:hypothetical protein